MEEMKMEQQVDEHQRSDDKQDKTRIDRSKLNLTTPKKREAEGDIAYLRREMPAVEEEFGKIRRTFDDLEEAA